MTRRGSIQLSGFKLNAKKQKQEKIELSAKSALKIRNNSKCLCVHETESLREEWGIKESFECKCRLWRQGSRSQNTIILPLLTLGPKQILEKSTQGYIYNIPPAPEAKGWKRAQKACQSQRIRNVVKQACADLSAAHSMMVVLFRPYNSAHRQYHLAK